MTELQCVIADEPYRPVTPSRAELPLPRGAAAEEASSGTPRHNERRATRTVRAVPAAAPAD